LKGIVSKRKDSAYRSGRSLDWLKMKNPEALAVKREAEEDWGQREVALSRKKEHGVLAGRRALELLASRRDGCTEALMLAHGGPIRPQSQAA
jgi:hypothetical protein